MTLYLKYRPQIIDELDLEGVRDALTAIIGSDNIPHAFLFSGPKGTGKTSAARILAKIINCEEKDRPCNKCIQCISITNGTNMDVIELDAASNRGIDDIRSLKENIMLAPASANKKIYIIDEAHMLTTEASNAFLKTLEEPPAHVLFILATTNPEKLPDTVISRLTRVDFTKATAKDIARQLARVVTGEKLKVEEKVISIIAKKADGSFRDAVKILESMTLNSKEIKESDIEKFLHSNEKEVISFFEVLRNGDTQKVLELVEKITADGTSIKLFTTELMEVIHQSLLAKVKGEEDLLQKYEMEEIIQLSKLITGAMGESSFSSIPQLSLEIALVKFTKTNSRVEEKVDNGNESKPVENEKEEVEKRVEPKVEAKKSEAKIVGSPISNENWLQILQLVRAKNTSIEALLRAAEPIGVNEKTFTIGVYYQFHKEKLEVLTNKKILEDVVCEIVADKDMKVDFLLTERKSQKRETPAVNQTPESLTTKVDEDIISAAKEIFG